MNRAEKILIVLLVLWLGVVTLRVCDTVTVQEMEMAWDRIGTNCDQVEHARMLATQAYLKAEKCQREQRIDDGDYPWLRDWFVRQVGRDPFRRMR
jgi:hypothetical protein